MRRLGFRAKLILLPILFLGLFLEVGTCHAGPSEEWPATLNDTGRNIPRSELPQMYEWLERALRAQVSAANRILAAMHPPGVTLEMPILVVVDAPHSVNGIWYDPIIYGERMSKEMREAAKNRPALYLTTGLIQAFTEDSTNIGDSILGVMAHEVGHGMDARTNGEDGQTIAFQRGQTSEATADAYGFKVLDEAGQPRTALWKSFEHLAVLHAQQERGESKPGAFDRAHRAVDAFLSTHPIDAIRSAEQRQLLTYTEFIKGASSAVPVIVPEAARLELSRIPVEAPKERVVVNRARVNRPRNSRADPVGRIEAIDEIMRGWPSFSESHLELISGMTGLSVEQVSSLPEEEQAFLLRGQLDEALLSLQSQGRPVPEEQVLRILRPMLSVEEPEWGSTLSRNYIKALAKTHLRALRTSSFYQTSQYLQLGREALNRRYSGRSGATMVAQVDMSRHAVNILPPTEVIPYFMGRTQTPLLSPSVEHPLEFSGAVDRKSEAEIAVLGDLSKNFIEGASDTVRWGHFLEMGAAVANAGGEGSYMFLRTGAKDSHERKRIEQLLRKGGDSADLRTLRRMADHVWQHRGEYALLDLHSFKYFPIAWDLVARLRGIDFATAQRQYNEGIRDFLQSQKYLSFMQYFSSHLPAYESEAGGLRYDLKQLQQKRAAYAKDPVAFRLKKQRIWPAPLRPYGTHK